MERNIEIENQIKEYFSSKKIIRKENISTFLKTHEAISDYLKKFLKENNEFKNVNNLIICICNDIYEVKICETCGKGITFDTISKYRNKHFCSVTCRSTAMSANVKWLTKNKESVKNSCRRKYGVDNVYQLESVKDKIRKSLIEKYGVDNPQKSSIIKNKTKETCMKKYGQNCVLSVNEIREKGKNTLVEKYGVEYPAQSEKILDKMKKTCEKRFNAKYFAQSKENQIKTFNRLKNGSWKEYAIPLFDENDYEGYDKVYQWKCAKCGSIFKSTLKNEMLIDENHYARMPRCLKCFPLMNGFSNKEHDLLDFCRHYFPNAEKDRQLIKPLELDIVIPELKLAIEFNGSYFHSLDNERGVAQGYHLMKTKLCNSIGYRLIHIWEDEWDRSNDEIKRRLTEIFERNENLKFTGKEIILDRSWFNGIEIPGYSLIEEIPPEIIIRNGFAVENCGKLRFHSL